jgi:hypothetical protein
MPARTRALKGPPAAPLAEVVLAVPEDFLGEPGLERFGWRILAAEHASG